MEVLKIEECVGLTLSDTIDLINSSLKELSISKISNIFDPNKIFKSIVLNKLQILRLSRNNFQNIELNSNIFEGIQENIEELYMDQSKISQFSSDAFSSFRKLKIIDLHGNDLNIIGEFFFGTSNNKKLISINLANSNIKSLSSNSFSGCNLLENLDLSENSLEKLEPGTFYDLENLINLKLQNNFLTTIPENLFETQLKSGKLEFLNLIGNYWNCDTDIVHLKQFLINTNANVPINGCEQPALLKMYDIKDLWCNVDSCTVSCDQTTSNVLSTVLDIFDMVSSL